MKIGIIAGTGFYNLSILSEPTSVIIETAYGQAQLTQGGWHGSEIFF